MKTISGVLLSFALTVPLISQASTIGTYTTTSTANKCSSLTCETGYDASTGITGEIPQTTSGGQGATTASSSESSFGTANALSDLSGSTYLPTLKVRTDAAEGNGAFAKAFGIQAYTYSGSASSIFNLDYNLHGSVGDYGAGNNSLRADIAVLIGDNLLWEPNIGLETYYYEFGLQQGGLDSLFINNGDNINVAGTLSFNLNPGDMFFVLAAVGAESINGYADGWNTFSMNFLDDTGLTALGAPAVSAVPVPAAAWLFGSALLGFFGISKRKKAAT